MGTGRRITIMENAFHITSRFLYIYMTIKFSGNSSSLRSDFVLQCGRAFEVLKIDSSIDLS